MSASGTATNRTNIELPTQVSAEILQKAQEQSAIMKMARKIGFIPLHFQPLVKGQWPVLLSMQAGNPTTVSRDVLFPSSSPFMHKKTTRRGVVFLFFLDIVFVVTLHCFSGFFEPNRCAMLAQFSFFGYNMADRYDLKLCDNSWNCSCKKENPL